MNRVWIAKMVAMRLSRLGLDLLAATSGQTIAAQRPKDKIYPYLCSQAGLLGSRVFPCLTVGFATRKGCTLLLCGRPSTVKSFGNERQRKLESTAPSSFVPRIPCGRVVSEGAEPSIRGYPIRIPAWMPRP